MIRKILAEGTVQPKEVVRAMGLIDPDSLSSGSNDNVVVLFLKLLWQALEALAKHPSRNDGSRGCRHSSQRFASGGV